MWTMVSFLIQRISIGNRIPFIQNPCRSEYGKRKSIPHRSQSESRNPSPLSCSSGVRTTSRENISPRTVAREPERAISSRDTASERHKKRAAAPAHKRIAAIAEKMKWFRNHRIETRENPTLPTRANVQRVPVPLERGVWESKP